MERRGSSSSKIFIKIYNSVLSADNKVKQVITVEVNNLWSGAVEARCKNRIKNKSGRRATTRLLVMKTKQLSVVVAYHHILGAASVAVQIAEGGIDRPLKIVSAHSCIIIRHKLKCGSLSGAGIFI